MPKTALELTVQEWQDYQPGAAHATRGQAAQAQVDERRRRAWGVARQAAELLRREFGANRVVVFGSLAHGAGFGLWSDVDLAAWGIPSDHFYRAVAAVTGLSSEHKIDLLDLETCKPALRQVVELEGVEL